MPPTKRTAQTKAPAAKRAKATPLESNFQRVLGALTDKEAAIPCREMFVSIAEKALKIPQSERHANQVAVVNMIREVLETEKTSWEGKIAEAQSLCDAAEQERTEKVSLRDTEDAKVKEQKDVLKAKRDAHGVAEDVAKECQEELATAKTQRIETNEAEQAIIAERDSFLEIQESFNLLKEGKCDDPKDTKKRISSISAFFKALNVEDGLVMTLPQVLGQKPEERGSFDQISLKQMEEYMEKHVAALGEKIAAAGVNIADAGVAVTAWDAAVEVALDKVGECRVVVETEEGKLEGLQAALTAARKVLKEQGAVIKKLETSLGTEQYGLQNTQDVLQALEFCLEYEHPAPEPAPEVVMDAEATNEIEVKDVTSEDVAAEMPSPNRKVVEAGQEL